MRAQSAPALFPRQSARAAALHRIVALVGALIAGTIVAGSAAAAPGDCPQPEIRTDPASCEALWEGIGLPVSNKDEDEDDFTYVCHEQYLVRHNNTTKTPDWVIERLTSEMVSGDNTRPKVKFRPELCAPTTGRAVDTDYTNSEYARGHQAASDDFAVNVDWMKDSFVFSNAVPQEGEGFNSSIWAQLEKMVRDLAAERGELYVITGPVYQSDGDLVLSATDNPCAVEIRLPHLPRVSVCGGEPGDPQSPCPNGVAIPAGLFKVIVDPGNGRVNAYLMPNTDHRLIREDGMSTEDYLATWRVSVRNVEDNVGYAFLPNLSRHERRAQLESCPATMIR